MLGNIFSVFRVLVIGHLSLVICQPALAQYPWQPDCPGGVCPIMPWDPPFGPEFRPPQAPQLAQVPDWIVAASVKVSFGNWSGSGTVFHVDTKRGLAFIVTNHHVVPSERSMALVRFPGGKVCQAAFVCTETGPDISVIAVQADSATPFVPLAEASPPAGTPVFQVGYPGGRGPVRRSGVSAGQGGVVAGKFTDLKLRLGSDHGDSGSGIFRQIDGRLCGILWGGVQGTRATSAVPIEYLHKMISDVDQYDVIVGVGVIRPKQPQQPAYPQQPPAGGIIPPPVVGPVVPTPPQPDPLLTALQQDLAGVKSRVGQLEQTAGQVQGKLGQLPQISSVVTDVQSKLGQLPQLAGVVNDLQSKFPQLANDVNGKLPAIAAQVQALAAGGGAAAGSSVLPLIGAIGGPIGAALGLAAMLLASLAKAKGGTSAPVPVTFHLPAGLVPAAPVAQQQQAA